MRRGRVCRTVALLGSGLLLLAAGCTAGPPSPSPTPAPTSTSASTAPSSAALTWVIDRAALTGLGGAGLSTNQLSKLFDNSHTYILGTATAESANIDDWTSQQSITLTDLRPTGFSRGAAAVLYDDEDWSLTPKAQQTDPAKYEAEGYRLARERGVVFIVAPALDLVRVLDPNGSGSVTRRFLNLDVIGQAARYADVVDIQAQGMEGTAQYASFVTAAAEQAKAANPDVKVLAGLSTNPAGRAISSATLTADANSVRGVVDGYWLNIPSSGSACPSCGTAEPQVAVPWLTQLLSG